MTIDEWKILLKACTYLLWENKVKKLSIDEWKILYLKFGIINSCYCISEEVKIDEFYRKLKVIYEKNTLQNKTITIRKLVNLKYKYGKSMTEHTNDRLSKLDGTKENDYQR